MVRTLSNLERFHGHLNFSGGSGYIKAIATNDTTGNIYVNTSDGKLYYKSNGTWSTITLYSSKSRAKNLVLRVSNSLKYAGLIDPSDANASKIRVRVGNTIYAVETSNSAMWNGNASVVNGHLEISPNNYIYNSYPIILGSEDDVEIFVKCYFRDARYLTSDSNGGAYFSLVRTGKSPTSERSTLQPAVMVSDIWMNGATSAGKIQMFKQFNNYTNGNITNSSLSGLMLAQSKDITIERDYKWIYDATTKYLDFVSETCGIDTSTTASLGMYRAWYGAPDSTEPTQTVYIAIGDMLSRNNGTMIVTDFYLKIAGVTVLSYSDLINQLS